MKTYFAMSNPPVKVAKIMMGDAAIGSIDAFNELPTVGICDRLPRPLLTISIQLSVIETYPQIIGYDKAVYNYFKEQ